jgi:hypothetical protein
MSIRPFVDHSDPGSLISLLNEIRLLLFHGQPGRIGGFNQVLSILGFSRDDYEIHKRIALGPNQDWGLKHDAFKETLATVVTVPGLQVRDITAEKTAHVVKVAYMRIIDEEARQIQKELGIGALVPNQTLAEYGGKILAGVHPFPGLTVTETDAVRLKKQAKEVYDWVNQAIPWTEYSVLRVAGAKTQLLWESIGLPKSLRSRVCRVLLVPGEEAYQGRVDSFATELWDMTPSFFGCEASPPPHIMIALGLDGFAMGTFRPCQTMAFCLARQM